MNAEKQFQEMPSRVLRPKGGGPSIQDFRPESVGLAQLKRGIIQRMAVMAVNNMDEQEDLLVWNNMEHATAAAPGAVGDLGVHKLIGIVSANDIVTSMTTAENSIPKYPKIRIVFQSCYAGINGLIEQVCRLLKGKGYPGVEVEGRTGVAFGFKGMNRSGGVGVGGRDVANEEATTNSDGEKAYSDFVKKSIQDGRFGHLFKRNWYGKPWEIIPVADMRAGIEEEIKTNDPKRIWNKLGPEKKMELVAKEMEEYWAACCEDIREKAGFKEERKYVKHI